VEWAYVYAHAFFSKALQIISAHFSESYAHVLLKAHEERMKRLKLAIERIKTHDPVVKSSDLLKAGINPGKKMGQLLQEAERIAFNEEIYDPAPIITRLRSSSLWPNLEDN
jgi:poly(A) polymerase